MKVSTLHLKSVPGLARLLHTVQEKDQIDILEKLLDVVHAEGRSQGYREGDPNHDED